MRFNAKHLSRFVLVGGTLVALSCAPGIARAQGGSASRAAVQTEGQVQAQENLRSSDWVAFDQFLDAHPDVAAALRENPDLINDEGFLEQHQQLRGFCDSHPRIRRDADADRGDFHDWFRFRSELGKMDQFLDTHRAIEQQLEVNPALAQDQNYLQNHPQLRDFLNNNPRLRDAFDRNPSHFMTLENRYENSWADRAQDATEPGTRRMENPNPDLTRGQVKTMDQFLDNYPNLERQIENNPSLLTDQNFLNANPDLRNFLNNNPKLRNEIVENPQYWAQREQRYENGAADEAQDATDGAVNRTENTNPDLTRGEVANMDQFLDSHPDIGKQLQSTPSLINNAKYLNDHPQLWAFLNNNPQVREEFTENPSDFMQRENRFENHENESTNVATMDEYLDKHPGVARDLNAYPARINDSDYLSHHKNLEVFLKKHPEVREEFTSNPSAFMRQESAFDAYAEMDGFLGSHKRIREDLDRDPSNVKDNDYLNHHKDLKAFLSKDPGVSDQFEGNPRGFMNREQRFDADRDMDAYLSRHKSVAKDLKRNPDRVKDTKYLNHHKDLKGLMDKHPQLEEAANTNPSAFMQEQVKFHEEYRSQKVQEKTKVQERATVHPH